MGPVDLVFSLAQLHSVTAIEDPARLADLEARAIGAPDVIRLRIEEAVRDAG